MSNNPTKRKALIIGAGPAGLTAALELLKKTDIQPVILEVSGEIGGISRTCLHHGNRIDIGGHRFFSKSDEVMAWWEEILPTMGAPAIDDRETGRKVSCSTAKGAPDPEQTDRVMLVRSRLSRILYERKFYNYPISLNKNTIGNLGFARIVRIGLSYLRACACPIRPEKNLEDFFINRFGRELYATFFRDYTAKVWGEPCSRIDPDWGAQRVKGLSVSKALWHAVKSSFGKSGAIAQKQTETSLIEQFLYPKYGPGQLWEEVARLILAKGGIIHFRKRAVAFEQVDGRIAAVIAEDTETGVRERFEGEYVLSTMPVKELIAGIVPRPPDEVAKVAAGLRYRDFITVGLLLRGLRQSGGDGGSLPDNWIYVQESDVRLGRIQIFNNWSPYMVADRRNTWLGLEYFCNEGDEFWQMDDRAITELAADELCRIGLIDRTGLLDSVVIRVPKAYPAYFGSYRDFPLIRNYVDTIPNLLLIGRNGMHRYNNMDHSMLSAMKAVDHIVHGRSDTAPIWSVNAETDYHENK